MFKSFFRKKNKYKFAESKNTKCVCCTHVLNEGYRILYVEHSDVGIAWRFMCGDKAHPESQIEVVKLKTMVRLDEAVNEIVDLQKGTCAQRKSMNPTWERSSMNHEDQAEEVPIEKVRVRESQVEEVKEDRMAYFDAVFASEDEEELEYARDYVKPEDVAPLKERYWKSSDWVEKRKIADVLQDQEKEGLKELMLNFLTSPNGDLDDYIAWPKAVAMTFQGKEYDKFDEYWYDREFLVADMLKVLEANGLKLEESAGNEGGQGDLDYVTPHVDNDNLESFVDRMDYFNPVLASGDIEDIEFAREYVREEDVNPLMEYYWNSSDWAVKRRVVEVLQDQKAEGLGRLMLDFLRAPNGIMSDNIAWAKAVAMTFQGEEYDQFSEYWDDRELLVNDVSKVLEAKGLKLEESPNEYEEEGWEDTQDVVGFNFGTKEDRMSYFNSVIDSVDIEGVQDAREVIRAEDVPLLMKRYWKSSDWKGKQLIVEILQDQKDAEGLDKLMLDFLRAPYKELDDDIGWAKAAALTFQGEEYDQFSKYWYDRELLEVDILNVLKANDLELEGYQGTVEVEIEESQGKDRVEAPGEVVWEGYPEEEYLEEETPVYDESLTPDQNLIEACLNGTKECAETALNNGAQLDLLVKEGTFYGCSPLLLAIFGRQGDVVDFLIEKGADINFKRLDKNKPTPGRGQNALQLSATFHNEELFRKLVDLGADIHATDAYGSSPLHEVAAVGSLNLVNLLLDLGAEVNRKNDVGRTPFHSAVLRGHAETARRLIDAGAEIDMISAYGFTPLMSAASEGFLDVVRLLLSAGAETEIEHPGGGYYGKNKGFTALVFAVESGRVTMVNELLKAGANPRHKVRRRRDSEGKVLKGKRVVEFATGLRADSIKRLFR